MTVDVEKCRLYGRVKYQELTVNVVPGMLPGEDRMRTSVTFDAPQEARFVRIGDELENSRVQLVLNVLQCRRAGLVFRIGMAGEGSATGSYYNFFSDAEDGYRSLVVGEPLPIRKGLLVPGHLHRVGHVGKIERFRDEVIEGHGRRPRQSDVPQGPQHAFTILGLPEIEPTPGIPVCLRNLVRDALMPTDKLRIPFALGTHGPGRPRILIGRWSRGTRC